MNNTLFCAMCIEMNYSASNQMVIERRKWDRAADETWGMQTYERILLEPGDPDLWQWFVEAASGSTWLWINTNRVNPRGVSIVDNVLLCAQHTAEVMYARKKG